MTTVMTFPFEMVSLFAELLPRLESDILCSHQAVLMKERSNGCYSCLSYYRKNLAERNDFTKHETFLFCPLVARSLADIPFTIINVLIYINVTYFITGQILSFERYMIILIVYVLMQLVGQSTGLLCGGLSRLILRYDTH